MNRFSKSISILLHPLMMPTLFMAIIIYITPTLAHPINASFYTPLLSFTFIFTFIFPVLSISILKYSGHVSSYELTERKERTLPLLFTLFYYAAVSYLFISRLHLNIIFQIGILSITGLILLTLIINLFWKISAHTIGISGIAAYILALDRHLANHELLIPASLLLFASGLIIAARLALKAHSKAEAYLGALLGFSVCFSVMYLFT